MRKLFAAFGWDRDRRSSPIEIANQTSQFFSDGMKRFFDFPVNYVPQKVVSLVPSITDSLIQLGLGNTLIGITTYCPTPQGNRFIQRVGGPATFDPEQVVNLFPDLVIGGLEENPPHELMKLSEAGIPLWVVFPKTVDETIAFLYQLAEGFRSKQAFQQIRSLEVSITYLRSSGRADSPKIRYFCPIWHEEIDGKELWMVFDNWTYAADLLSLFGLTNCFGNREDRASDRGETLLDESLSRGDTRYYRVSTEDVVGANPELILLPSEPYPFDRYQQGYLKQIFGGVAAVKQGKILQIDGKLIFWYGTRLGQALQELPSCFLGDG